MKKQPVFKIIIVAVFCGMWLLSPAGAPHSFAADFILEYVGENYKETTAESSYQPIIYHSIQVRTDAGTKMLILTGDDRYHRRWLRQYIAQGKQFIAKVPDEQDDLFISSSAFEIDVTNVHPFNLSLYRGALEKKGPDDLEKPLSEAGDTIPAILKKPRDLMKKNRPAIEAQKDKAAVQAKTPRHKTPNPAILKKGGKRPEIRAQKENENQEGPVKIRANPQRPDQEGNLIAQMQQDRFDLQQYLTALAADKAVAERRRKADLQEQWRKLKDRLMENERIRNMEMQARNRELGRRWMKLLQSSEVY